MQEYNTHIHRKGTHPLTCRCTNPHSNAYTHPHPSPPTHSELTEKTGTGGFVGVVGVLEVKPPPHRPGEGRPQAVHGFGGNAIDELWTEENTAAIINLRML